MNENEDHVLNVPHESEGPMTQQQQSVTGPSNVTVHPTKKQRLNAPLNDITNVTPHAELHVSGHCKTTKKNQHLYI